MIIQFLIRIKNDTNLLKNEKCIIYVTYYAGYTVHQKIPLRRLSKVFCVIICVIICGFVFQRFFQLVYFGVLQKFLVALLFVLVCLVFYALVKLHYHDLTLHQFEL